MVHQPDNRDARIDGAGCEECVLACELGAFCLPMCVENADFLNKQPTERSEELWFVCLVDVEKHIMNEINPKRFELLIKLFDVTMFI